MMFLKNVFILGVVIGILFSIHYLIVYSYSQLDPTWKKNGFGYNFTNTITNSTIHLVNDKWINFTSLNLGISLDIPNGWIIEEKPNSYEVGIDFQTYSPEPKDYFRLILAKDNVLLDKEVKQIGLSNYTDLQLPRIESRNNTFLIEGVDMNKYKVGGYETSTYLFTSQYQNGEPHVVRAFYVNQNGHIWYITYQGPPNSFDSPSNQQIMNHILKSIKFLT